MGEVHMKHYLTKLLIYNHGTADCNLCPYDQDDHMAPLIRRCVLRLLTGVSSDALLFVMVWTL